MKTLDALRFTRSMSVSVEFSSLVRLLIDVRALNGIQ